MKATFTNEMARERLIFCGDGTTASRKEEALFKTEGADRLFKERGRRAPPQGARFRENRRVGTGHDVCVAEEGGVGW